MSEWHNHAGPALWASRSEWEESEWLAAEHQWWSDRWAEYIHWIQTTFPTGGMYDSVVEPEPSYEGPIYSEPDKSLDMGGLLSWKAPACQEVDSKLDTEQVYIGDCEIEDPPVEPRIEAAQLFLEREKNRSKVEVGKQLLLGWMRAKRMGLLDKDGCEDNDLVEEPFGGGPLLGGSPLGTTPLEGAPHNKAPPSGGTPGFHSSGIAGMETSPTNAHYEVLAQHVNDIVGEVDLLKISEYVAELQTRIAQLEKHLSTLTIHENRTSSSSFAKLLGGTTQHWRRVAAAAFPLMMSPL